MKTVDQFPHPVECRENVWIELADGCRLAARIWLPRDAAVNPVPAVLEYLPYRKRDATAERDQLTHPYFAGHGYACLRVDMRGNGDSDGVMLDEYAPQEQADCIEVLDWIAAQDWCTGKIGMIGISWGGFNGLQVAALAPEPLKAVITLCSTDDRYGDDIHFKGGCLLSENLGWGATMLAFSSRPPDPALVGDRWREMWRERLENEPFLAAQWLVHPHRNDYWRHGSVCEDYAAIKAAVLAVGGWNDAYSNAIPRLLNGLRAPCKAIIGPWAHKYPHFAVPEPRMGFLQEALRWWDRWLKDEQTGVEDDSAMRAYVLDSIAPEGLPLHWPGRWIADQAWPPESTRWMTLHLNQNGLEPEPGPRGVMEISSPQTVGVDGGEQCIMWLGPEFPGEQSRDDAGSLTFQTPPLDQAIDIVGAPVARLTLSANRPVAFVAIRLNDVRPDGQVGRISYTMANLCHRNGHEQPEPVVPGERYDVRLQMDDIARRVPAGHRLRVSISTSYWPLMWPAPEPVTLSVAAGESMIEIPVRQQSAADRPPGLPEAVGAPPLALEVLREPSNVRDVKQDPATGEMTLTISDDFGKARNLEHGLITAGIGRERHTIMPDDPLSARMETHWTEELERDGWRARTETYSSMTADACHFYLTARIEAYEGDTLVFSRDFDETIARRFG